MDPYIFVTFESLLGVVWFSFNASFACNRIRALAMMLLGWRFDARLVATLIELNVASSFSVLDVRPDTKRCYSGACLVKEWYYEPKNLREVSDLS